MTVGDKKAFTEFRLTSFAVDHPTSVMVLMTLVALLGLRSYITVPKESFPEIVAPYVQVTTVYPGVAPNDIETLITRIIEEEVNGISDVKEITSVSQEGISSITVEFDAGEDISEALQKVREKVDLARPDLPSAAEDPVINEINTAEIPIMQVNVAGPYGLVRLREVAEDLEERLELIPTVLDVRLAGGLEREVKVDVDLAKLKFYGLAFDDVIDAIRNENITIPGGTIDVGSQKFLVRVPGEFGTTGPMADIVVTAPGGAPIYIRDVATVDFGFKEKETIARLDGQPVVALSVVKRSGENIIETADAVRAVIAEEMEGLPPGTNIKITSDQSKMIHDMVSSLENNIISGLILVVAVLLFFLGIRTAWFVGLAIPMSMLLSFIIIGLVGMSMNMIVLFSLILALGMLVDNAIVVVENIFRFREEGFDRPSAAKFAAGEVAWPIIASTATTLAAFLPLAFWPGEIGEFMKFLPLTLIMTLSSSLFVGLVIIPTLCSLFLDTEATPGRLTRQTKIALQVGAGVVMLIGVLVSPIATLLLGLTAVILYVGHHFVVNPIQHWFMDRGMAAILKHYASVLDWALGHRAMVVFGAASSLVVSVMVFGMFNAGIELFPEDIPPDDLYVQIEAPLGTRLDQTDAMAAMLEAELEEFSSREDFASVLTTVGYRVSGNPQGGASNGTHLATIGINLVDFQDRNRSSFASLEAMRNQFAPIVAGADVSVELPAQGPTSGPPISAEIIGENPVILKELGDRAVRVLEQSPVFAKLDGLENSMNTGQPELIVDVDREKAALYGLTTRDVGMTVRSAINGTEASTYRDGKDEYDITVRLAPAFRDDVSSLADLTVVAEGGRQVPLSSVANWQVGSGSSDIVRKDLDRVATVSSDVRAGFNANAVLMEVQQALVDFEGSLPTGYRLEFTGQQQDQQESQAFLLGAFIMAVFLIAFILVSQFDSVFKPMIILTSVLLSTVGVLLGLLVFRMPFGVIMTGVGVISLAGVVVNNAIVLIDYIGILRVRDGLNTREALMQAGITRFRPVVLTAITTVLGLVPLAIGLNFDFIGLYTALSPELYWGGTQAAWWGPMAIAVIAGLSFATFLTLLLVPVLYSIFDDLELMLVRNFVGSKDKALRSGVSEESDRRRTDVSGEPIPV